MSHLAHLNKDVESWARVDAKSVLAGSPAQAENVLIMALFDIQKLGLEVARLKSLINRVSVRHLRET